MASVKDFIALCRKNFYAVAFRKKIYNTLDELQTDLDLWLEDYNNQRTHSGKYCFGRTPMQTFIETLPLAKQKCCRTFHPQHKN